MLTTTSLKATIPKRRLNRKPNEMANAALKATFNATLKKSSLLFFNWH